MALFLLYRRHEPDRNERGLHSVIVQADTLAEAVAHAEAAAPWPGPYTDLLTDPALRGKRGIDRWGSLTLSTMTANQVLWIEGDCASLRGVSRGGTPFP